MSEFKHGLSDKFIEQLAEEANKVSWWADVLNDAQLFIALRNRNINVYWRGQSLFKVMMGPSGLSAKMHPKFLIEPGLHDEVTLVNGRFGVEGLVDSGIIRTYEGPETLKKMKKAAGRFSGLEDTGCHDIILANPQVIDREIGFSGLISLHDGGTGKRRHLVDLLTLESDGDAVRLVFWEAKHFINRELRALGAVVPVCEQIKRYRQCLSEHRHEIESGYKRVAENLVAFEEMGWKRRLSPLIKEVAKGRPLTLGADDEDAKVGLVIFGFNKAERDEDNWQGHLARLKSEVKYVIARGNPKDIPVKLCACD
ncbi:MAG: hypothetical protein ABSH01_28940 [Terriglobia bacterium]|jgi:hypothetical protein